MPGMDHEQHAEYMSLAGSDIAQSLEQYVTCLAGKETHCIRRLPPPSMQAEHYLEKLHHKLEKELMAYLKDSEAPLEPWPKFRCAPGSGMRV